MKTCLSIVLIFISVISFSQKVLKTFSEGGIRVEYEVENGNLNGKYLSKYSNGAMRAEGNFVNNVRTGNWKVFDSLGRKIHERNYTTDHLTFEKVFPDKVSNGPASLFDTAFYQVKKGAEGFIPYFPIKERTVLFTMRIWRNIPAEQNKLFYEKDLLYKTIYNYVSDSSNVSYCSSDEEFAKQIFPSQIKKYSLQNYKIIDWKIKEDYVLDTDHLVSDVRIIGICPVGVSKASGDTTDLYWIYFPYVRKPLSMVTTKVKNKGGEKQTLDDLFFFRNFSSMIYKKSNVQDKSLKDYCKTESELERERTGIIIGLIETEHQFWMGNPPR